MLICALRLFECCALISEWSCLSPSEVSMYWSGSTSVGRLGYTGWIIGRS